MEANISNTLIVLYGLPGTGKSSIAEELRNDGFCYTNLAIHPDFKKLKMPEIVFNYYKKNLTHRGIVFEGVLGNRNTRVNYINFILEESKKLENDFIIKNVYVFYLDIPLQILQYRRQRSIEEYQILLKKIQIGDNYFNNFILHYDNKNIKSIKLLTYEIYNNIYSSYK